MSNVAVCPHCDNFFFVITWERFYDQIGYPGSNDPEAAWAIIITAFAASHQNLLIATKDDYVNVRFHSHFSAVSVPHFGEVTQRLATILLRDAMICLSIEVLQPANPRIRSRASRVYPVTTPSEDEQRCDIDSRR